VFDFEIQRGKRYVLPIPKWLRGDLLNFNRLYAFPTIPESLGDSQFIILDSGAYTLSKRRKTMDIKYIDKLYEHYKKYKTSKNIICVAPDVAGDFKKTMKNYEYFRTKYDLNVMPVLQFPDHEFNWSLLKYQIEFYKDFIADIQMMFFAKRGAYSSELYAYEVDKKIRYIQNEIGIDWIHLFAAGWNRVECRMIGKLNNKITMDSIAYYLTTNNYLDWGHDKGDRQKNSIENAKIANIMVN